MRLFVCLFALRPVSLCNFGGSGTHHAAYAASNTPRLSFLYPLTESTINLDYVQNRSKEWRASLLWASLHLLHTINKNLRITKQGKAHIFIKMLTGSELRKRVWVFGMGTYANQVEDIDWS